MLTANTTLQYLELSFSVISDIGVFHISEALKYNNSLTELHLHYNRHITNTGAVSLSLMLFINKSLKILSLCKTSVGKEGVGALMNILLHNQVLIRLMISEELEEYCEENNLYNIVKDRIVYVDS